MPPVLQGFLESPYTSWTRDPTVAQRFANQDGPGEVVLRTETGAPPDGSSWRWEWSPDQYGEQEVLLEGKRDDLEVLDLDTMKQIEARKHC